MTKRILLTGLLGGVAMFVWSSIAHMALPLGEAGVKQIENEQPLLTSMQSTISAPGLYIFPGMTPGLTQEQYQQKIASGASGLLVYLPKRDFVFGKLLAVEFGTEVLQALIAAYLLSLTRLRSFSGCLGLYAALGLLAAVATNIPYWNWYAFPTVYTAAYGFTQWVGYIAAGLVAAAMKVREPQPAAAMRVAAAA